MARGEYGLDISQKGTDLGRAADFQKVLDSDWPFLDVAFEVDVPFEKVTYESTSDHYWALKIFEHNLGYIPAFTYRENIPTSNILFFGTPIDLEELDLFTIVATEDAVYLRGPYYNGDPQPSIIGNLHLTIFACRITEEFTYPVKDISSGPKAHSGGFGAWILKDGKGNKGIGNREMSHFVLNTSGKALAVHKTGTIDVNPAYRLQPASVSAINTTTDILTVGAYFGSDFSWVQEVATRVSYTPNDFTTYPTPTPNPSYVIPVSSTTIKLATSRANALAGIAIDFSAAGSLPAIISPDEDPDVPRDTIVHNVGYPPLFLLAGYEPTDWWTDPLPNPLQKDCIRKLNKGYDGFYSATETDLRLLGSQSVATGLFAYVILKDPLEEVA